MALFSNAKCFLMLAFFFVLPYFLCAQKPPVTENKETLKLFVECNCERTYIRQEIKFVSHVRDQSLANVQLFIYDVANGSGGRTYLLEFKGTRDYDGIVGDGSY